MKTLRLLFLAVLMAVYSLAPAGNSLHVTTTGTSGGDGSQGNPYDFVTGTNLAGNHGGDTIWVHGGTYLSGSDCFFAKISGGSPTNPVVIRNWQNQQVKISTMQRGFTLIIQGNYAWYWGLEITQDDVSDATVAWGASAAYFDDGTGYGGGYYYAVGDKLINCVIHDDYGAGVGNFTGAHNCDLYGCIVYYNGREATIGPGDSSPNFAYGMYSQNDGANGGKVIDGCVFINQFGDAALHIYSEQSHVDNYRVAHNVFCVGPTANGCQIVLGNGTIVGQNNVVDSNYIWGPTSNLGLGYREWGALNNETMIGNVFANSETDFYSTTTNRTFNNNIIQGTWNAQPSGTGNTWYSGTPTGTWIYTIPNVYDATRANIVVYNWYQYNSVDVDLSSVVGIGSTYVVKDAQNFLGPAIVSGTYSGGTVSIPINGMTIPTPFSIPEPVYRTPQHTAKTFGVFVVIANAPVVSIPSAPVATAATSITSTGFTANWNSSSGATSYSMDVSTSNSFPSFVSGYNNLSVGNVTSAAVTGLSTGVTYYVRIRANNANGSSANSNTVSVITSPGIPPAPTATAATSITSTGFTANWSTSSGATGYNLDVATNSTFTLPVAGYSNLDMSTATSATLTGLATNTTYYYRVRARNASGTSASSNTIFLTTSSIVPSAPVLNSATGITSTSFTISWSSSVGASGYDIDVATDVAFTLFVSGYNNTNVSSLTSFGIVGLTPGTTYFVRVRANSSVGTSGNSNVVTATTTALALPSIPVAITSSSISSTGFTVNWNAANGATGYYLDVAYDNGFTSYLSIYHNLDVGNVTSYVIPGLAPGTTYYSRLRSYNSVGTSGNSNIVTTTTTGLQPPLPPVATAGTNILTTGFTANWNAASGATGYDLDVSTLAMDSTFHVGDSVRIILTTDCISARSTPSLTSPIVYDCVLAGVHGKIIAGPSPDVNGSSNRIFWQVAYTTGITGWSSVNGLEKLVGTFVSGYSNKDVGNVTTLPITGLSAGTLYNYRLRAYNSNGTSGNSNTVSVTTSTVVGQLPSGTLIVSPTSRVGAGSVTLIWTASNATSASIDNGVGRVSAAGGNGVVTVSATTTFTLTLTNSTGHITISATVTVTSGIVPPTVTTLAATNLTSSSGQLNGSINPNGYTTTYHFEYGTTIKYGYTTATKNAGAGVAVVPVSAAIKGLRSSKLYHYRLVGASSGGQTLGNDVTFTSK